jgi:RecB family endonuclease NucS
MPFNMSLWKVNGEELSMVKTTDLDYEERLEKWIVRDPSILGLELMIIGQQVITEYGGRIDLLGIDRQGDLIVIELKRSRTPRDIIAQVLDYASWVRQLNYQQITELAEQLLDDSLSVAFSKTFDAALPEPINVNHSMVIVASELDDATERIVQYLANEHSLSINIIFFNFYKMNGQEILGRAWLMDPQEVQEKIGSGKKPPWSGYYFVNVGEGDHRNWDDNRKYGYIGAGQGQPYAQALRRLKSGDKIFAYMSGRGYVGFGEVTQDAVMIRDFVVGDAGKSLLDLDLKAPRADDNRESQEKSEYAVRVKWFTVYSRDDAKTFKGIFANPNIVCKLRHEATVQFLEQAFEVTNTVDQ